jgi:prenyl protein peptidase
VQERIMAGGRDISYIQTLYLIQIKPVISPFFDPVDESQRWGQIRSLLVAPLAEEIVFRGCMISPLLSAGLTAPAASFVAPMFFGTAHFHHAYLKVKQGNHISQVVLSTVFQFAYTTLFGAYAAYAFIRTGSIVVIFLSHSFCNTMGLPDLGFLQSRGSRLSPVYPYRWVIMAAYLMGVSAFIYGFQSNSMLLPPPPGRLVESINESMQYSVTK